MHAIFDISVHFAVSPSAKMTVHPLIDPQRLADINVVIMRQIIRRLRLFPIRRDDITAGMFVVFIPAPLPSIDPPVFHKIFRPNPGAV